MPVPDEDTSNRTPGNHEQERAKSLSLVVCSAIETDSPQQKNVIDHVTMLCYVRLFTSYELIDHLRHSSR
jgi:hypothetical protein